MLPPPDRVKIFFPGRAAWGVNHPTDFLASPFDADTESSLGGIIAGNEIRVIPTVEDVVNSPSRLGPRIPPRAGFRLAKLEEACIPRHGFLLERAASQSWAELIRQSKPAGNAITSFVWSRVAISEAVLSSAPLAKLHDPHSDCR